MTLITDAPNPGKPERGLSRAMQTKHDDLCSLIRDAQDNAPYEHVGQIWAMPVSQEAWCKSSGLKLRTFQALVNVAPIRRYQCNLPGGKVTLLRVGNPGPEQHRVIAQQMAAYFTKATKEETVSRAEFGMLCGLARDWPDGFQTAIFRHAVIRWPSFMDDVRAEVEIALEAQREGYDPFAPDALSDHMLATARRFHGREDRLSLRLYRRPFIPVLRAFWPIAAEMFIDHRQRCGGAHPPRIWQRWCDPAFCAVSTS